MQDHISDEVQQSNSVYNLSISGCVSWLSSNFHCGTRLDMYQTLLLFPIAGDGTSAANG
jgi:hypothetical protein